MAATQTSPQQQQETQQRSRPSRRAIGSRWSTSSRSGRSVDCKSVGQSSAPNGGRHGLHFRRNFDDKVFSDFILLRRDDGELTTVALDEFTTLRRL